jgi:hypothetical protein
VAASHKWATTQGGNDAANETSLVSYCFPVSSII